MKLTSKSLGLQMTLIGGTFLITGMYMLVELLFHIYLNLPFGWKGYGPILLSWEMVSGTVLLILGGWMLYRGIRRLRM